MNSRRLIAAPRLSTGHRIGSSNRIKQQHWKRLMSAWVISGHFAMSRRCLLCPQKRTLRGVDCLSAKANSGQSGCYSIASAVLHDVLSFGARAKHAVGEPRQRAPMRLESRDVLVENGAHAAEALGIDCVRSRNTGTFSPPIASRVQARP